MSDENLTLYYFPGSYYSLKVLLFLYEKNIQFKGHIINIHGDDQWAKWYLQLNPSAEVPVLQDGSDVIVDSEAIWDYLEQKCPDPVFIPDVSTQKGHQIQKFRQRLQAIAIDQITYGTGLNQQFCSRELQFPALVKWKFQKHRYARAMAWSIARMQETLWTHPGPQTALRNKLRKVQARADVIFDENKVEALLDGINPIVDEMEAMLKAAKKECGDGTEYWLCGANYSIADMFAAIFLYRLEFVSIEGRYFSADNRPLVLEYYSRLKARPAVKRIIAMSRTVVNVYMKTLVRTIAVKGAKLGLVVGAVSLGVWAYKQFVQG